MRAAPGFRCTEPNRVDDGPDALSENGHCRRANDDEVGAKAICRSAEKNSFHLDAPRCQDDNAILVCLRNASPMRRAARLMASYM